VIERELTFDVTSYSADAIQRAAYRLSDRLSVDLTAEESSFRCVLHLSTEDTAVSEAILSDFRNEVLDQVLRERIRVETEGVRNVILALAFSNTGLISEDE
jgi:His-Xaa-Ser system protein HxsD